MSTNSGSARSEAAPSGPTDDDAPAAPPEIGDLWRTEYEPMVRLARALVDSIDQAEEIVQDAFARTLRKWRRIDRPVAYLRTAVVNGARSELRRREVRRRLSPPAPARSHPPADENLSDETLAEALATLSPRRRIVLVLRFYADLPDDEIADALGVRPATVRSLVARGLADLREVIQP